MDNEGFPGYQWSKFVNGDRGEQFVVRANDLDTFKARITEVKEWLRLDGTPTADPESTGTTPLCKVHGVHMKERLTKTGGNFYDHRQQFDGVWKKCSGQGWKD